MTPEEQEAVRRALAATPPEGPMPPEVVARLEAVIAGLAAEPPSEAARSQAPADVTDLEQRRRRRWPRVLVAAAGVAVLAYGAGVVLDDLGPLAETASDAGAGAAVEERAEGGGDTDTGTDQGLAPQEAGPPGADEEAALYGAGPVVELREASLRRDVLRHLDRDRVAATEEDVLTQGDAKRYSRRDGTCLLPEVSAGDEVTPARLDGRRATLVLRAARDGVRVADVYWCGDGRTLLARTQVPARR
ncbi:MAG: hypothetical protein ACLGH4_01445 [Actinomycetes bacterium]